jgi:ubiquinone/menaquinone biosynthesis C-methylase UbiE
MITQRSEKELAFLHDLFVATDWGERFSGLIDEHVVLPEKGRALYLGVGTGTHAIALQERAAPKVEVLGVDEHEEYLALARAKASALKDPAEFRLSALDQLAFADNNFDFVIGDGSLLLPHRLPKMLSEMVRVTKPGSSVAMSLATSSSFGEFFSIYWEVLHNSGLPEQAAKVESLITELPTVSEMEELAEREGLEEIRTSSRIEEFEYETGEQFLNSPLISDFLMRHWLDFVPATHSERIAKEIQRTINEERHETEFTLSVKATLLLGRKGRSN